MLFPVLLVLFSIASSSSGSHSTSRFTRAASDCGLSTGPETLIPLILNGSPSHQGEFPWVAGIYFNDEDDRWEQRCMGTLISPHIVLTAAHCVTSYINGSTISPGNIKVGLGKYYRDYYKNESFSVISDVREIVVPRYYSGMASYYALDIAIIDLNTSIQVSAYIMPACVDWARTITLNPNTEGQVAGWGFTENETTSDTLLSTKLSYTDNTECIRKSKDNRRTMVTHDKFCGTSTNGSAVGKVDSGTGLTIVNNGLHFIFGIASTRMENRESFISLFTDISNLEHHAWLEEQKTRLDTSHRES